MSSSEFIANRVGIDCYTGFRVGIEFEIEAVQEVNHDALPFCMDSHDENSLRNGGVELVTPPVTKERAIAAHRALFHGGGLLFGPGDPCSPRCSTHVHVNFSDQTEDKARQFVRAYYWLEPMFFDFVADHRRNNIFCVQLSASHMLRTLLSQCTFGYLTDKWHKYTALNAKPLGQFGTVEFRHLEATRDTDKFEKWLIYIERLYHYTMNQREPLIPHRAHLMTLVREVFPEHETSHELLYECASNLMDDVLISLAPSRDLITARIKESKVK